MPTLTGQPWLDLSMEIVLRCLETAQALARTTGRGAEIITDHADPTMQVDVELERTVIGVLKRRKVVATVLSEELIKGNDVPILRPTGDPYASGQRVYVCIDPLDGSKVYHRNIRAFWYACVGVYSEDREPLAGAVLDLNTRQVFFYDGAAAYEGLLQRSGRLRDQRPLTPSGATTLDGCYLETYTMNPGIYLPVRDRLLPLIRRCRFVVPNGGPGSFCDVAAGMSDVYVELSDFVLTEVFSGGLMIADAAGCTTTDVQGSHIPFDPDISKGYSVICAATPELHRDVMEALREA